MSGGSTVLEVPNANNTTRLENLSKFLEEKGIEATVIDDMGMKIIDNGQFLAAINKGKLYFLEYPSNSLEIPDSYLLEARVKLGLGLEMPHILRRLYPENLLRSAFIVYVKNAK